MKNCLSQRSILSQFSGKRSAAYAPIDDAYLSEESQAALRQLSLERLMAYGVHHADGMELRGRVWSGEGWQAVATDLAERCLRPPEGLVSPVTRRTQINRLFRASALLRMSQMMMVNNTEERFAIFRRAGELYEEAAKLAGDRERMLIETKNGVLNGWRYPSESSRAIGRAVVIGGIEGWAMDFGAMGTELARRGIETLLLDGPGQGESRMVHNHFLRLGWEQDYFDVFDQFAGGDAPLPLGFVGNSMGGAVAMHLAARDSRIVACCNNGGTRNPGKPRVGTMARKVAAHVGDVTPEEASVVWSSVNPADPERPLTCHLLVVHGALDPLVSTEDAESVFEASPSKDKHLIVFSDGDHCIYNHADDKHALIGDWMFDRLRAAA